MGLGSMIVSDDGSLPSRHVRAFHGRKTHERGSSDIMTKQMGMKCFVALIVSSNMFLLPIFVCYATLAMVFRGVGKRISAGL